MIYLARPSKGHPHRLLAEIYISLKIEELDCEAQYRLPDAEDWSACSPVVGPLWEDKCEYRIVTSVGIIGPIAS